jgi:hypothetical protein
VRATPSAGNPVEEVSGDAVEFRYWDIPLEASLIDVTKPATVYALFYFDTDNKLLKADWGTYPPGGVNEATHARNSGTGVRTTVLARNVSSVKFSHTTKDATGDGNGCIKMNMTLLDAVNNDLLTVKTATLMRTVWP